MSKEQVWKQVYDRVEKSSRNVLTLMKMVRESKRNNVDENDVWKSLLTHRWSNEIMKRPVSPCLNEDLEYDVIHKVTQELNLNLDANSWVPEEYLAFGKELYAIIKCQFPLVEAAKLSQLFNHLVTSKSLNTLVASTMRNIQPLGGKNIKDFSAINMWYERLDTRYNFSLGPVILPLLKTDTLTQLAKLDPPYMKGLKVSTDEHQLDNISTAIGKLKLIIHMMIDKLLLIV